ncbi:MAG: hypothetical protein ABH836_07555 [Candidatus Omnitrophota bacterium]
MRVLIAAVAEHAWVEKGCLSICRTFDSINADKFPYKIPRLSIGLRVIIRRSEAGEHNLNITLADSDGKKIMNTNMKMNVKVPEESVSESSFSFALNGQNVIFPKQGDYVVDIVVDNRLEASIPIYVREKKQTAGEEGKPIE